MQSRWNERERFPILSCVRLNAHICTQSQKHDNTFNISWNRRTNANDCRLHRMHWKHQDLTLIVMIFPISERIDVQAKLITKILIRFNVADEMYNVHQLSVTLILLVETCKKQSDYTGYWLRIVVAPSSSYLHLSSAKTFFWSTYKCVWTSSSNSTRIMMTMQPSNNFSYRNARSCSNNSNIMQQQYQVSRRRRSIRDRVGNGCCFWCAALLLCLPLDNLIWLSLSIIFKMTAI